jgi:hypothetical protein
MQFWFLLLAANAWATVVLVQALRSKEKERLSWLKKRALVCVLMALVGALLVVGLAVWAIKSGAPVSDAMHVILNALLLMLLPIVTRTIVNHRALTLK